MAIKKVILSGQEVLDILRDYVADRELPGFDLDISIVPYGTNGGLGRVYVPIEDVGPQTQEEQYLRMIDNIFKKKVQQKELGQLTVEVIIHGAKPKPRPDRPDPVHGDNVNASVGSVR